MAKNLAFPAICTTQKFVNCNADPVVECVFRIPELGSFLDKRKLPREIVIGVDATAVTQRVQYDPRTNQVCGLRPALNSFGVPVAYSFPAVSAVKIKEYTDNSNPSTVAFVVMARPLASNAPAFCLCLYGSDNRFDAAQADSSFQFIAAACAKEGVTVRGFSTDGDTRYLKTMIVRTLSLNPDNKWSDWFGVREFEATNFCVQDTIHLLVKLKSKFLQASAILPFGPKHIISRGHIVDLIHRLSKDLHELTMSCVNPKDKMNFRAAEKLCSAKVTELLRLVPGCEATATYLDMMREIKESYLKDALPIERIEMFWKWIFVLRIWRKWIVDTPGYKLGNNFITSNAYSCIELNGHALISMCRYFRNVGRPELFRPGDFSSQDCADFFRNLRSMSSMKSSQTTFSILEMKHKVRRLDYPAELHVKLDGKVVLPRAKKLFAKESVKSVQILPDDTEIESAVMRSFQRASEICLQFGIEPPLLPPPLVLSTTCFKTNINVNEEDDGADLEEEEEDEEFVDVDLEENSNGPDGDLAAGFFAEEDEVELVIEDLAVASSGSLGVKTYDQVTLTKECPFVKVKDGNGKVCTIRKSTWIWLLMSGDTKLSSDRLERVKSMSSRQVPGTTTALAPLNAPSEEDTIFIGDWCAFRDNKKIFIGRIESFSYLSGTSIKKQEYSLLSAPTDAPSNKASRGLGCLCSWFTISYSRQRILVPVTMDVHGYFDVKFYICTVPRPKVEDNKFVVNFTLSQLERVKLL